VSHKDLSIKVNPLSRVEGEGALEVTVADGEIRDLKLRIYEPPRFFEQLLVGRSYHEVSDIVARICGICPVAYQMSALHALESILGIQVPEAIRRLRRLFYCGEWIESHTLHIYMLSAPDFLGYESAMALAEDQPDILRRGLRLKKAGNDIVELLGGRSIHPVSPRVGGFTKIPSGKELQPLRAPLQRALEDARETVRWVSGFSFPHFEREVEFVALSHPDEYPMNEGRLKSTRGLDIAMQEYEEHFEEIQVPHSHAFHSTIRERADYVVGPLARINLNRDRLSRTAQASIRDSGIPFPNGNLFTSIVARAVEVVHAVEEALEIIRGYEPPVRPYEATPPPRPSPARGEGGGKWERELRGSWITEAPRGILYHAYQIDQQDKVQKANIVPPTSQNLRSVEEDLKAFLPGMLDRPVEEITRRCEALIRNYDPCISCSTHFLTLKMNRGKGTA
jgi:coenzyme F420-reducing hydrogenase alpha subunit